MVCACRFLKRIRENLLTIDHHEVEFIQRGREVVSRESKSVNEVVDSIVMRCEEEQLGAFLVAANLSSHVVRQSGCHSDDITDVLWRKFVAPSGQAGRPVEKAIPRTVVGYILDVHRAFGLQLFRERVFIYDQRPRFVQRRIVNEGSAWPPA